MTTGPALRTQGVADVLAADTAAHRGYAELVREAVDVLGCSGDPLDAESVRAWIESTYPDARPHHPNVLPGAMKALAEKGRLVPVGWREASRPCARGRVLRVWRTP